MRGGMSDQQHSTLLPWLPRLPDAWEWVRLKYVLSASVAGGTPISSDEQYWTEGDNGTAWVAISDITRASFIVDTNKRLTPAGIREKNLRILPPGTLLYSMYASVGKVAVLGIPATTNQAIIGLVPDQRRIHQPFLRWWLESIEHHVGSLVRSNTQNNLNAEQVLNFPVPLPSLDSQRAIADFLDEKTAAIDALIAKKERLIELIEEKRQATITRAVTMGLDPDVPMKDSGVEWLGEVPAHWTVKRLMHLTPARRQIMYGIVLPGPHVEGGIPIVKSGDCWPDRLRLDRLNRTTPEIEAPYARARLEPNDIVYAIRGSVGASAKVPPELRGANLTQDAARIAPRPDVESDWLLFAMQSRNTWWQVEAGILGATVKGINIRDLKRIYMPVPPTAEQREIATALISRISALDGIAENAKESVTRLREYRQTLISAAVTGQLNLHARSIRTAAPTPEPLQEALT